MRNGCTGTKAHTLLEVIIVMLIVSTVLAIAVPELGKKLAVVRLDALAGQMAADIRTVQQMAINEESAAYFMEFYPYG
ncbi:MAG: N-terminal methylation protein, partial [Clostridia bacterium 62_21]